MKRLLLHVCCAPCSTHAIEKLRQEHELTLFFYNPNIEPIPEYEKRMQEAERYAEEMELPLVVGDYDNIDWHNLVRGIENEKEGGERCNICFRFRLLKTAQYAKENGFDLFTTTLSVSPFKNAEIINKIGKEISEDIGTGFLESDFKKDGGYMHSIELSKKYNLYRQHYCGCLFSK